MLYNYKWQWERKQGWRNGERKLRAKGGTYKYLYLLTNSDVFRLKMASNGLVM